MEALIDGDMLLYAAGFAAEKSHYSVYYGNGKEMGFDNAKDANEFIKKMGGERVKHTEVQPLGYAIRNLQTMLSGIHEHTGCTGRTIFLTGDNNFRDNLVDYYKANREDAPKPTHYTKLKEYLIHNQGAILVDGMEADDAMGIAQWKAYKEAPTYHPEATKDQQQTIICTRDKDLDMIPGWHYDWKHEMKYFVSERGALEAFYTQLLTGDSTDNIPGLYKLTGKRATAKMKSAISMCVEEEDMWLWVQMCYGPEVPTSKLIEIGNLLWILREPNTPWLPPGAMYADENDLLLEEQERRNSEDGGDRTDDGGES